MKSVLNEKLDRKWVEASQRIADLERQIESAYQQLEINGVPRERAKSVSNGIDVLVTRLTREVAALTKERDELLSALKCAESLFDRKWNSVVGSGCEFHWQPVGNWRHYTCKMTGETFIEAIAKVQP